MGNILDLNGAVQPGPPPKRDPIEVMVTVTATINAVTGQMCYTIMDGGGGEGMPQGVVLQAGMHACVAAHRELKKSLVALGEAEKLDGGN